MSAVACAMAVAVATAPVPPPARAATAAELTRDSAAELSKLYARKPSAKVLGQKAKGILAGFMFGGQIGEGALR